MEQIVIHIKDKKKAIDRCAMCANLLVGHDKTTFTIMTRDKKRRLACCGHCGLFMLYKMKGKAKRAVGASRSQRRSVKSAVSAMVAR